MNHFIKGLRLAVGLALGLPFLIFLIPFFVVYFFIEHRAGRPMPFDVRKFLKETFHAPSAPSLQSAPSSFAEDSGETIRSTRTDTTPSAFSKAKATSISSGTVLSAFVADGESLLGGEIARELARQGYRVAIAWEKDREKVADLVQTIHNSGGSACSLNLDLGDQEKIQNALDLADKELGGIPGLLINNASKLLPTGVEHPSWEELNATMRHNLHGPLWLSLKFGSAMVGRENGNIIHILDLFGEYPMKGHSAFSAARAGMAMATRALAADLGPWVRVNAIAPGLHLVFAPHAAEELSQEHPNQYASKPQPMAVVQALHYFLKSPTVTGEILHVDGGRRMHSIPPSTIHDRPGFLHQSRIQTHREG
ncbi:MAG: SDR family NAD(P)-dependent oxidoreductase [Magnetococcales bacterium]|nr:SDR family NAD(P)-dependent oxidoreductase [Magnetococcales bacterium]